MEHWTPVEGYESSYLVSTQGRVFSILTNQVIKPKVNNRGYLHVILRKNGTARSFLVHRLVAKAFVLGEQPGDTVNHIDENKTNNCSNNLEWCTLSSNCSKYYANHTDDLKGVQRGKKEIPIVVEQIHNGKIVKVWKSAAEVKRSLGFSTWSIAQCCRGKRKSAYGYTWRYAI